MVPENPQAAAQAAITAATASLRALSLDLHAHPELNYEERHAHAALTALLEGEGFQVQRGAYDLPTAFEARAGAGGPRIAFLCEYDALPGIGHACGHNLIAVVGVAAGLGLRAALAGRPGTIVVLGTPAEEGGGGKIRMIDQGAFASLDVAMMAHPAPVDAAWTNILAVHQLRVEFHGKNAHAAAYPWEGVNALDALVLAYNGISMLRQQLPPDVRIHGVVRDGGAQPNIIPDYAAADFYVRAGTVAALEALKPRVLNCFQGAAQATGCRLDAEWQGDAYSDFITNDTLAQAYVEQMASLDVTLPTSGPQRQGPAASTDMGNVSYVLPSMHPFFRIESGGGNHTPEFTAAAALAPAHAAALRAAEGLALLAYDLCTDPGLLERVRREFLAGHGG